MSEKTPPTPYTWKPQDDAVNLSKATIQVRLPVEVERIVRSLPNRSAWLRRVIKEAIEREGLG
ncbi:MAG: hypothetical protein ACRC62_39480 [Microcoleus sp.]